MNDSALRKNGHSDLHQSRLNPANFNGLLPQKDLLDDHLYDDGIAKDMRELELRFNSELEEPNKNLSRSEEVIASTN